MSTDLTQGQVLPNASHQALLAHYLGKETLGDAYLPAEIFERIRTYPLNLTGLPGLPRHQLATRNRKIHRNPHSPGPRGRPRRCPRRMESRRRPADYHLRRSSPLR